MRNIASMPPPPLSNRRALVSLGLLVVSLVAVVGLAKTLTLTPALEAGVAWLAAPKAVVGIVIAPPSCSCPKGWRR